MSGEVQNVLLPNLILGNVHQDTDLAHTVSVLRACRERPRSRRAAEERHEALNSGAVRCNEEMRCR